MSEPIEVLHDTIAVDGATLSFELAGSGPDLVLVHSGITDRRMWDDQFLELARSFRTARYDLRGFGESSAVTGEYSHVDDLRAVIDGLGFERPHVVAASLGARVAIDLAVDEPDAFESMVLIGPALSGSRFEDPRLRACWEQMEAAWDAGDIERVIELETAIWVDGPTRPDGASNPVAIERVREMQRGIYAKALEDDPERDIEPPALERLGNLRMPLLVLVGEHDVSDIHHNASRIVEAAATARLVVIPGTGHLSNLEEPDAFNEIVLEFLGGAGSG
jgi:pimeloyl-ACP methyl ester carboxylesterase